MREYEKKSNKAHMHDVVSVQRVSQFLYCILSNDGRFSKITQYFNFLWFPMIRLKKIETEGFIELRWKQTMSIWESVP